MSAGSVMVRCCVLVSQTTRKRAQACPSWGRQAARAAAVRGPGSCAPRSSSSFSSELSESSGEPASSRRGPVSELDETSPGGPLESSEAVPEDSLSMGACSSARMGPGCTG